MHFSFQHAMIDPDKQKSLRKKLDAYRIHLWMVHKQNKFDQSECSMNLPFSTEIITILKQAGTFRTKELKTAVIVGIGGSNLGTQAVYEALPKNNVELLFLDTVSDTRLSMILEALTKKCSQKKQFLIVYVSKSGTTMETNVNFDTLIRALKPKYGNMKDRCIAIVDEKTKLPPSPLTTHHSPLFLPSLVGGRFSVFSAVGLFPLAIAGFDVHALCAGARKAVEDGISTNSDSIKLACTTHSHVCDRLVIHNSFFFAPELESIGKWERQLFAESLGKKYDRDGKIVHAGFTPIVSIGSTDLHSMAQLYFGGPRDKFTNLISIASPKKTPLSQTMSAITQGVAMTYQKLKLPFVSIVFDKLDEKNLGYFLQTRMLEAMYLGDLMHLNTFDQPAVELYKNETRRAMRR